MKILISFDSETQELAVKKIPDHQLSLTPMEEAFFQSVLQQISDSVDFSQIHLEKKSESYTSAIFGQHNDFLRFKLTEKTQWLSIRMDPEDAKNNIDNPLFAAQKNKKQLHWKAKLSPDTDLSVFKTFLINSCNLSF